MFFASMVTRGLGYRNDGPNLAAAKKRSYSLMFSKYPPDAVRQSVERVRRDGWMPAQDVLEAEILDSLEWRTSVLKALFQGDVMSPEQIQLNRERRAALKMVDIYNALPVWDRGTELSKKKRADGLVSLQKAVNEFRSIAREDHEFERELNRAIEWIEAPFEKFPYREKSEAERLHDRAMFEQNKSEMVQALLESSDDAE